MKLTNETYFISSTTILVTVMIIVTYATIVIVKEYNDQVYICRSIIVLKVQYLNRCPHLQVSMLHPFLRERLMKADFSVLMSDFHIM